MKLKHILKTSLKSFKTNRMRTLLTLLGIAIGICAIIIIMSVGKGAEKAILSQFKGLGSQTISIEPGREPEGPSDFAEMYTDSLGKKELDRLTKIPGIANASPMLLLPTTLSYAGETFRASVLGGGSIMAKMLDIYPNLGFFFSDDDVKQRASVVVIGHQIKKELFGQNDALGKRIKIKNRSFRIIGILPPKGQIMMMEMDKLAFVPISTAQFYLSRTDYYHAILIQAENESLVPRLVEDIKITLREMHNISDPDKDVFHIVTQEFVAEKIGTITGILTVFLLSVALISLIVGGIGIMNIMLVSVSERTREIGLRKALGAQEEDILKQFLFESIIMTIIGGFIGISLGVFFSYLISLVLAKTMAWGWVFVFPWWAAILGLSVAGLVGLIFGLYPAKQAAKKSPIEALKYE